MRNLLNFFVGTLVLLLLNLSDLNGQTVKDIDGNSYKTVNIGRQTWMAENLRVAHYANGESISYFSENPTAYPQMGLYVQFQSVNAQAYNWYAVNDERGLCPTGWRVPSKSDWEELVSFLEPNVDIKLKSKTAWGSRNSSTGGYYINEICSNCFQWSTYKKQTLVCPVCNDKRYVRGAWIPREEEVVNENGNNSSGFNATPSLGMSTESFNKFEGNVNAQAGYWSSTVLKRSSTMNSLGYTKAIDFFSYGLDGLGESRMDSFLPVRCLQNK